MTGVQLRLGAGKGSSTRAAARPGVVQIGLEKGGQQVWMPLEHVPQHRQKPLVGQQCLPRRFQKQTAGSVDVVCVVIAQQIFPRIQLEQNRDAAVFVIQELPVLAERDFVQITVMRTQTSLARGPAHGLDRAVILRISDNSGKVQIAVLLEHLGKPRNQCLVYPVELVGSFRQHTGFQLVLQPLPLKRRAFIQGCWRIGVIFQQLGGRLTVVGEIEPSVYLRVAPLPAFGNKIAVRFGDRQFFHQAFAADDLGHRLAAHVMQRG